MYLEIIILTFYRLKILNKRVPLISQKGIIPSAEYPKMGAWGGGGGGIRGQDH